MTLTPLARHLLPNLAVHGCYWLVLCGEYHEEPIRTSYIYLEGEEIEIITTRICDRHFSYRHIPNRHGGAVVWDSRD